MHQPTQITKRLCCDVVPSQQIPLQVKECKKVAKIDRKLSAAKKVPVVPPVLIKFSAR